MRPPPGEEGSNAAQFERTVLAWNRAAIAVVGNGALLLREGAVQRIVLLEGAGLAVVVVGVGLWILSLTPSKIAGRRAAALVAGDATGVAALAAFALLISLIDVVVVVSAR